MLTLWEVENDPKKSQNCTNFFWIMIRSENNMIRLISWYDRNCRTSAKPEFQKKRRLQLMPIIGLFIFFYYFQCFNSREKINIDEKKIRKWEFHIVFKQLIIPWDYWLINCNWENMTYNIFVCFWSQIGLFLVM